MWEEFRNDIFAWPWAIINNIVFACFHFNSINGPGRSMFSSNTATAPDDHLTSSQQRGAAKLAGETHSGQQVMNIQLECAYPPTSSKESDILTEKEEQGQVNNDGLPTEKAKYPWD